LRAKRHVGKKKPGDGRKDRGESARLKRTDKNGAINGHLLKEDGRKIGTEVSKKEDNRAHARKSDYDCKKREPKGEDRTCETTKWIKESRNPGTFTY